MKRIILIVIFIFVEFNLYSQNDIDVSINFNDFISNGILLKVEKKELLKKIGKPYGKDSYKIKLYDAINKQGFPIHFYYVDVKRYSYLQEGLIYCLYKDTSRLLSIDFEKNIDKTICFKEMKLNRNFTINEFTEKYKLEYPIEEYQGIVGIEPVTGKMIKGCTLLSYFYGENKKVFEITFCFDKDGRLKYIDFGYDNLEMPYIIY
jgi:hypothetical protein